MILNLPQKIITQNSYQFLYLYSQMIIFKLVFFYALLLITYQQTILPISNCLSNCLGCQIKNPTVCSRQIRKDTGQQGRCIPYYDGADCTLGGSYYNIYAENGVLNNFVNWSVPNQPPRQQCALDNSNESVIGIGPFNSTIPATKTLQFSPTQGVRRLLIKLGVAVSDSRISPTSGTVSQQIIQNEQNGTTFITTIDTTTNVSLTNSTIPFLNMKILDLLTNGSVVLNAAMGYQNASLVLTKCGYIYQYQLSVDATNGVFQQLLLELSLPTNSNTLWWLMDFRVEVGCSGFSVGSTCSSCLTGFYPALTKQGYANGCKHCSYECSTCTQNGSCLTCEKYATLNASRRSCFYPSTYKIYESNSFIKVVYGSSLQTNSTGFKYVFRSQNKTLNLSLQLANNKSYFMKFYILYPISYNQNLNLRFKVDDSTYQTKNLDFNKATLSDVNNGQTQLYITSYTIERAEINNNLNETSGIVTNTFYVELTSPTPTPTQQFYIADMTIVQYGCSKNCLDCSFSLSQITSCKKCLPFYRIDTNCLTCANGFFQIKNQTQNRCVKCHANCKQCVGPSNLYCIECYTNFELAEYGFNQACINKIVDIYFQEGSYIGNCTNLPTMTEFLAKPNCAACMKIDTGYFQDPVCISCWLSYNYAWGRCRPSQSSGLTFYASDIVLQNSTTSWTSNGLVKQGCSSDYPSLVGVPNIVNNLNHLTAVPTTLSYSLNNLPGHYGLIFFMDIFKVDYWASISSNKSASLSVKVYVDSPNFASSQFVVQLTNSIGANICGEQSNEMILALQANVADHTSSSAIIRVVAPDKGIFVRQLSIYLGNCIDCSLVSLAYSISLLPVYSDNQTQTGLDTFITFNKPISFISGVYTNPAEAFANSFRFYVGYDQVRDDVLKENKINDPNYNSIKYFLPLSKSYINQTVTVSTSQGSLIYTQDAFALRQLPQSTQTVKLQRYVDASPDTRNSISQLSTFFNIFSWIALIVMIVAVCLGVGVVFEQFSLMMQLIFYHIYITSWLLPPTIKIPLANASRMEHLNYFTDIASMEKLFGLEPLIPSNYIFTQFNIDIYFLRSIYPLLIINAVYIGWFLILKLLKYFVYAFNHSPNKVARFFRSITDRPLAYFDQIFRYQYLAVMWACMIQFTNFTGEGGKKLNLAICIIAFIIAFLWPFAVTVYTAFFTGVKYIKHSIYLYHDIYYLKISSVGDQPKFYLYTIVKTGRLLAYAVFIGLFVNQSIIGPVLLIFVNLIDGLISYFLDIYRTGAYLLTRLIENALLIIAAILCLVIFAFSDASQFEQSSYESVGFGLSTVFVLMVVNGLVRFFYLTYKKIEEWSLGNYDVGEKGEKENFDDKSPVKVPQSQRFE